MKKIMLVLLLLLIGLEANVAAVGQIHFYIHSDGSLLKDCYGNCSIPSGKNRKWDITLAVRGADGKAVDGSYKLKISCGPLVETKGGCKATISKSKSTFHSYYSESKSLGNIQTCLPWQDSHNHYEITRNPTDATDVRDDNKKFPKPSISHTKSNCSGKKNPIEIPSLPIEIPKKIPTPWPF